MNRAIAPQIFPFAHLKLPSESVYTLSNGIKLHVCAGGEQPISHLSLVFNGGVAELGSSIIGNVAMSQLIEGTKTKSGATIAEHLDYNGARTVSRSMAHHSSAELWFLNTRADDLLPLWMDCVLEPSYPQSALSAVKLKHLATYTSTRQQVNVLSDEKFTECIYGKNHPLGKPVTREQIDRITREELTKLHEKIVDANNTTVFLSGLVDDKLLDKIVKMLEQIPAVNTPVSLNIIPIQQTDKPFKEEICKEAVFQNALTAGMALPGRDHPDYIPLRLAIMALGGYFGSRLMLNVREEKGLTYGISASLMGVQEGSYLNISAEFDPTTTQKVIEEIKHEMNNLATNPPQGQELERLRLFAATSLAEIMDTPHAMSSYYSNQLYVGTPPDYFELQLDAINKLSSSVISEMASKYLLPESLSTVSAGIIPNP